MPNLDLVIMDLAARRGANHSFCSTVSFWRGSGGGAAPDLPNLVFARFPRGVVSGRAAISGELEADEAFPFPTVPGGAPKGAPEAKAPKERQPGALGEGSDEARDEARDAAAGVNGSSARKSSAR